jgi:hypothetical protein
MVPLKVVVHPTSSPPPLTRTRITSQVPVQFREAEQRVFNSIALSPDNRTEISDLIAKNALVEKRFRSLVIIRYGKSDYREVRDFTEFLRPFSKYERLEETERTLEPGELSLLIGHDGELYYEKIMSVYSYLKVIGVIADIRHCKVNTVKAPARGMWAQTMHYISPPSPRQVDEFSIMIDYPRTHLYRTTLNIQPYERELFLTPPTAPKTVPSASPLTRKNTESSSHRAVREISSSADSADSQQLSEISSDDNVSL